MGRHVHQIIRPGTGRPDLPKTGAGTVRCFKTDGTLPLRNRNRSGFILGEFLIVLLAIGFLLPITLSHLSILQKAVKPPVMLQDQIALAQLRHITNLASSVTINAEELTLHCHQNDYVIHIRNHNLLLRPGTQFLLTEIDAVLFEQDEQLLIMHYYRKEKEFRAVLGLIP